MGQKVHPKGFRLGYSKDWDARWFARKSYGQQLVEDFLIRDYLDARLENAEVSRVEIEKAGNENVRIIIHTSRPGMVIGKAGQDIGQMRTDLAKKLKRNVEISVQEERTPELDATLVAKNIASQIERRANYKQVMKRAVMSSMKGGALGVKIGISGRLGGAEIARDERVHVGSVPLHTLRADIDYGFAEARTTYGIIGVTVWISRGEVQRVK